MSETGLSFERHDPQLISFLIQPSQRGWNGNMAISIEAAERTQTILDRVSVNSTCPRERITLSPLSYEGVRIGYTVRDWVCHIVIDPDGRADARVTSQGRTKSCLNAGEKELNEFIDRWFV